MPTKQEEVKDIPVIYPLISIKLHSTAIVNGRPIYSECEEILNLDQVDERDYKAVLSRLLHDFEGYIVKVIGSANSPAGQRELQNILDTHARPAQPPSEDPPSLPSPAADQGADTEPLTPPAG